MAQAGPWAWARLAVAPAVSSPETRTSASRAAQTIVSMIAGAARATWRVIPAHISPGWAFIAARRAPEAGHSASSPSGTG